MPRDSMSRRALPAALVVGGALLLGGPVALAQTSAPAAKDKAAPAAKKKKGGKAADDKSGDDPKTAEPAPAPGGAAPADAFGPAPPPAPVVETVVAVPKREPLGRGKAFAAVRLGAAVPQVVSSLSASFLVGGEIGWAAPRLPLIGEGLALAIDIAFSQPGSNGDATDTHAGGSYAWAVTQKTTSLGLTVLYRVNTIQSASLERGKLVPYLGVGPRLFFLQTISSVTPAGAAVSEYTESSTKIGFGIPLGVDYALGPGRVFLEAMFLWAPFNHNTTGPSNAGALTIEAGYRMFFGLGS